MIPFAYGSFTHPFYRVTNQYGRRNFMTEPHYGISDKGISFVGSIGERVCRNAERAVNAVKSVGRSAKHNVGHSFAKVNKAKR